MLPPLMPNHSNSEYIQFPLPSIAPIPFHLPQTISYKLSHFLSSFAPTILLQRSSGAIDCVFITLHLKFSINNYIHNAALPSNRRAVRQPGPRPGSQRDQQPPSLRCKSLSRVIPLLSNVANNTKTENMHQQHAGISPKPGMRQQQHHLPLHKHELRLRCPRLRFRVLPTRHRHWFNHQRGVVILSR